MPACAFFGFSPHLTGRAALNAVLMPDISLGHTQAGKLDEHEDALPASSSASESQGDSADADLETGIAKWRTRGLPPAQSKAERWGAPYHLQFAILFTRSALRPSTPCNRRCQFCSWNGVTLLWNASEASWSAWLPTSTSAMRRPNWESGVPACRVNHELRCFPENATVCHPSASA